MLNIKPQTQNFGKNSSRAIDSLPRGEQQAKPLSPQDDGKFTIDDIICPFHRTAFNEGVYDVDAEGNVTNLPEVLKEFAGASWVMNKVATHAAKKLSTDGDSRADFKADSFNLQDLAGSDLDHTADSQILRNGFNQERLDKALSFSSDGERLTLKDLREFQKANLAEEPGKRGEFVGGAEFALLIKVFGRTDGVGTKFIKNADMVSLYKDNKWPEGWERPKAGSLNVLSTGFAVKEYFSSDSDGKESAAMMAAQGDVKKSGGVCPFLNGQSFDMGEAAKQHSDKLQ